MHNDVISKRAPALAGAPAMKASSVSERAKNFEAGGSGSNTPPLSKSGGTAPGRPVPPPPASPAVTARYQAPHPEDPQASPRNELPPRPPRAAVEASKTRSLGRSSGAVVQSAVVGGPLERASGASSRPPLPQRAERDTGSLRHVASTDGVLAVSSREEMLEKKLLELQRAHMILVERCATYETHLAVPLDSGGAPLTPLTMTRHRTNSGGSHNDLLGKLRGRFKESKTRKEQKEALVDQGDVDAQFWSQTQRKLRVDLGQLQVLEPLVEAVGGSLARLHVVEVDGFICVMKELDIGFARELNISLVKTFESEVQFLENLPAHPNIVRYLFHHFDHEKGRARLFMTKYSSSLRDVLVRRQAGIGDPTSGLIYCRCCPRCTHVERTRDAPSPLHFSLGEAAAILLDIAQGVQFLHFHQILHRDLKSDNIFVQLNESSEISRVLIGDFDSAKSMRELQKRYSTVGTPGYIAPEVWSHGDRQHLEASSPAGAMGGGGGVCYTYAADVYRLGRWWWWWWWWRGAGSVSWTAVLTKKARSYGILMFELMSFHRPFDHLRGMAIQEKLMDHAVTLANLREHLTPAQIRDYGPLMSIMEQCIAVDPGDRPTISYLVLTMTDLVKQHRPGAAPVSRASHAGESTSPRPAK